MSIYIFKRWTYLENLKDDPLLNFCTKQNIERSKNDTAYLRNKNFPPAKKQGLLSGKPRFIIILKFIIKYGEKPKLITNYGIRLSKKSQY